MMEVSSMTQESHTALTNGHGDIPAGRPLTNGKSGAGQSNGAALPATRKIRDPAEMAELDTAASDPDFSDDEGDSDPDTEDIDDDDEEEDIEPQSKKMKMDKGDDNVRKSQRERKVPKKFLNSAKEKQNQKQKKTAPKNGEVESEEALSEEAAGVKTPNVKNDDEIGVTCPRVSRVKRKKVVEKQKKKKDDGSDDYSDLSDEDTARNWKRSLKRPGHTKENGAKPGRKREVKKYEEEAIEHSSDYMTDQEDGDRVPRSKVVVVEQVEDVDFIEFVLDHRIGKLGATGETTMHWSVQIHGDPNKTLETEETEQQFLIKWKGWSHINNTWESDASLSARKKGNQEVKGLRKLVNYQNKLADFEAWKKNASPEDIEYQDIEIEMGREMLSTYMEIERIFACRKNENGGKDYYVKWKNLAYDNATWEDEFNITNYYQDALNKYEERISSKSMPKNYDSAMKEVNMKIVPMREQPEYIGSENYRLREYQLEGLNFLLNAWSKGNSVILADEMGLGKTIQTICFLKYLWYNYPFKGPMLVCVPLSTMAAWQKEFSQWAPQLNVITYIGNAASRTVIRDYEMFSKNGQIQFNVLLTNYEMVVKDREHFSAVKWSNIVVDEAHRLKSEESLLYKVLGTVESKHRLLLTGTPLQNSLKELWCLLSYIKPVNFEDWETFEANYGTEEDKAGGYVKLHTLLKPYIIRRLKKDVEKSLPGKVEQILRVDMTVRQKRIYKLVLTRNFTALSKGKNQVSLLNILMQLRKTCNHADLIQELEEGPSNDPAERMKQLIYGSGKLLLLDKLLTRFREKGDRVLIFSQMVKLLDLLEEYLSLKRYPFQRLDGSVSAERRKQSIAAFNDEKSLDFCFLLSTKAGGLGINLQTANRVIIFDSDFNPQNDLQAIARAHRIGQKEEVKIFRLVASSSVDEDIIQRAKNKMVLDHLVIQNMDTSGKSVIGGGGANTAGIGVMSTGANKIQQFGKEELNLILKFGAQDLFKEEEGEQDKEVNLDAILESAEMREEEEAPQSEANKELLSAFKCTTLQFEETEKEMETNDVKEEDVDWKDIIPAAMVEMHREKKGIELYSDPEELFNPIAKRRKKRMKHLLAREGEGSSRDNSRAGSRAGSLHNSDLEDSDISTIKSDDSDMSDGEKEIRNKLKVIEGREKAGGRTREFRDKKMVCLECGKKYVDSNALIAHMAKEHSIKDYAVVKENKLNQTDTGNDVKVGKKRKRGQKLANTRCFKCNKCFQHRLGYKLHVKKWHDGVEPPENLDPANLAKPDDRIECLICEKKFASAQGLKLHIQRLHLGIKEEDEKKEDGEDGDEDLDEGDDDKEEGGDDGDKEGGEAKDNSRRGRLASKLMDISPEDRKLIERMYYKMRKYGCKYCPVRFNNKTKLIMHEGIHEKQRRPVVCPYCDKSYSRADKLRDHCAREHPDKPAPKIPETNFSSQPAYSPGFGPGRRERLPKSMRTYTDDEFAYVNGHFKCPECPRLFSSLPMAKEHLSEAHVKTRMVQCELCPAAYNDKKGLYQHMFRKHPKNPIDSAMVNPFVMSSLSSPRSPMSSRERSPETGPDGEPLEELQPIKMLDGSIQCPLCPKNYTSTGGFWIHKRNRHPRWFNLTSKSSRAPERTGGNDTPPQQKHGCDICGKYYASYASLYHHRKSLHPHLIKSRGPRTDYNTNAFNAASMRELQRNLAMLAPKPSPMVVNVGGGGIAHKCLKCTEEFGSLRDLAAHIEESHQNGEEAGSSQMGKFINNIKAFGEVDIRPVMLNGDDSGSASQSGGASPRKYREKCYKCPQCGKGYNDAERLKTHIHERHTMNFFNDIEPNTDVVVKNHHTKLGFDIYKVLCVYTTGMRMKGAKFRYDDVEKNWRLTETIDKHVSKRDVIMIVTSLKRVGERRYKMDESEYKKMTELVQRLYLDRAKANEDGDDDDGGDQYDDEEEPISDPLAISPNKSKVNKKRMDNSNDDFEDNNVDDSVNVGDSEVESDDEEEEEEEEEEESDDEEEEGEGEEDVDDEMEEDMSDEADETEIPTANNKINNINSVNAVNRVNNFTNVNTVNRPTVVNNVNSPKPASSVIISNPVNSISNVNTVNNMVGSVNNLHNVTSVNTMNHVNNVNSSPAMVYNPAETSHTMMAQPSNMMDQHSTGIINQQDSYAMMNQNQAMMDPLMDHGTGAMMNHHHGGGGGMEMMNHGAMMGQQANTGIMMDPTNSYYMDEAVVGDNGFLMNP